MPELDISLDQLRGMIGHRVLHDGLRCEVIEVLEDGPALVLVCAERDKIQTDQFGNPSRRTPQTYTIPVLNPDRAALHPAFLDLELVDG